MLDVVYEQTRIQRVVVPPLLAAQLAAMLTVLGGADSDLESGGAAGADRRGVSGTLILAFFLMGAREKSASEPSELTELASSDT